MKKRIAVIGAGAVGGYLGGHLARTGQDVTLIDPWPEHVRPSPLHVMEFSRTEPSEPNMDIVPIFFPEPGRIIGSRYSRSFTSTCHVVMEKIPLLVPEALASIVPVQSFPRVLPAGEGGVLGGVGRGGAGGAEGEGVCGAGGGG